MRILFVLLTLLWVSPALADSYDRAFDAADAKDWASAFNAANATGQNYMRDYVLWRSLRGSDNRPSARQILDFMTSHRDWPEMDRLAQRAAEALLLEGYGSDEERRWKDLSKQNRGLFDYGWIYGDYSADEQKQLMQQYSGRLTPALYEARIDRLLWDNEATRARPLLPQTSGNFRRVAEARVALILRERDAPRHVSGMPRKLQYHPALLYTRINYLKKKGEDRAAESLLRQLPKRVPYGAKWWPLWRYYAREAIGEKRYRDAYEMLRPVTEAEQGEQAQLFWLRGWVLLQFLNNASEAYKDFYTFYKHVGTPISKARGAFWAGLAAQKNGNGTIARNWFSEGARYPATFYGQLTKLELSNATRLSLQQNSISSSTPSALREQLSLIRKLADYHQDYSVEAFLFNLADRFPRENQIAAIAEAARKIGYPHLAIRIGKEHFGDTGDWLQPISHPVPNIPRDLAVEPALTLAIARQESEFNPDARSGADARGLMQLLPSTARSVAKKNGIRHSPDMLSDPNHNMRLGSLYLAELIDKFDGAYPLAIAAYNAGPGRVSEWQRKFGPFPRDLESQLRWLEQIPFTETRNYVQRVLENLQVYRELLGEKEPLTPQRMFGQ